MNVVLVMVVVRNKVEVKLNVTFKCLDATVGINTIFIEGLGVNL
jgi:hypothetical protein